MTSILAILGDANTGKTTTLWYVYLRLMHCASSVRFFLNEGKDYVEKEIAPNKIVYNGNQQAKDFRAVLTIRHNVYVITSKGDDEKAIHNGLNWALRFTPTAIICASRWHGKTTARAALNEYVKIFPHLFLYPLGEDYTKSDEEKRKTIKAKEFENTKRIIDLIFDRTKKNIESNTELDTEIYN